MRGSEFADLKAVVTIAQQGNFSRAAKELGVSPSALSQTIRDLEARLCLRLFNRTTRSVSPTEAGRRLLSRVQPLFQEFDAALEELSSLRDTPAGTLRINAQQQAIAYLVQPILSRFQNLYPDITLDLVSDEGVDDIFARGFDAGIRLGEYIEKDMVSIRVGPDLRQIAVAAPDYLKKNSRPKTPQDLHRHRCINWRQTGRGAPYNWEFARNGEWFEVTVKGTLIVNDCSVALRAAVDGLGITLGMEEWMSPLLKSKQLTPLLREWSPPFPGFYLYHPSHRHVPATLRAFIDVLKEGRSLHELGKA